MDSVLSPRLCHQLPGRQPCMAEAWRSWLSPHGPPSEVFRTNRPPPAAPLPASESMPSPSCLPCTEPRGHINVCLFSLVLRDSSEPCLLGRVDSKPGQGRGGRRVSPTSSAILGLGRYDGHVFQRRHDSAAGGEPLKCCVYRSHQPGWGQKSFDTMHSPRSLEQGRGGGT